MKSTMDKLEGLSRKLNIEVPAEKVRDAFTKVYKGIQKNATLKGFRKGKAPITAIRSSYYERVKQDVLQDLISESYQKALDEHALDPVGYPKIHFEAFEDEQGFHFSAELEVRPEISLKTFEGLKVKKEKLTVGDKEIGDVIENIRQQQKEFSPVLEDRGAQNGDAAVIDFEGIIDGAPLENGSGKDHRLELGSDSFIPGFEEGVVGMKIGDNKEVQLSFPEDYHNKEIAGKPVTFKVTLNKLEKATIPELNDELAKKLGDYESVEKLKQAIREDMITNEEQRIKGELRDRILRALVDANPIEVPESLKLQQKEKMIEDVQNRMRQQGMSEQDFNTYKEKWDSDFDDSASFMVKSGFLVDALADKLDLRAKDEQIVNKIEEHAKQTGIEVERLQEYYGSPERQSSMRFQLTEENVLDFLISKADITEVAKDKLKD